MKRSFCKVLSREKLTEALSRRRIVDIARGTGLAAPVIYALRDRSITRRFKPSTLVLATAYIEKVDGRGEEGDYVDVRVRQNSYIADRISFQDATEEGLEELKKLRTEVDLAHSEMSSASRIEQRDRRRVEQKVIKQELRAAQLAGAVEKLRPICKNYVVDLNRQMLRRDGDDYDVTRADFNLLYGQLMPEVKTKPYAVALSHGLFEVVADNGRKVLDFGGVKEAQVPSIASLRRLVGELQVDGVPDAIIAFVADNLTLPGSGSELHFGRRRKAAWRNLVELQPKRGRLDAVELNSGKYDKTLASRLFPLQHDNDADDEILRG